MDAIQELTKEAIDVMEGDELDALVAARLMGWKPNTPCDGDMGEAPFGDGWYCTHCGFSGKWGTDFGHSELPLDCSTSILEAWLVVEKLRRLGWTMHLNVNEFVTEPWDCRLFYKEEKRVIAHGASAPLAISRAALKTTLANPSK